MTKRTTKACVPFRYTRRYITRKTQRSNNPYLCTLAGQKALPTNNIVAIAGQPKTGKSTFLRILTKAFIGANNKFDIVPFANDIQVHYFDTEQSTDDLVDWVDDALYGLDDAKDADKIKRLSVDSIIDIEENESIPIEQRRKEYVFQCIEEMKEGLHLVIIDGGADFLEALNDEREVSKLRNELLKERRPNVCIAIVIHHNPGSDKMRGHWGSEIERKAHQIITLSYDERTEIHTAKITKGRRGKGAEISYIWTDNGIEPTKESTIAEDKTFIDAWEDIYDPKLMPYGWQIKTAHLSKIIKDKFGCQDRTCTTYINKFVQLGKLKRVKQGIYEIIVGQQLLHFDD